MAASKVKKQLLQKIAAVAKVEVLLRRPSRLSLDKVARRQSLSPFNVIL